MFVSNIENSISRIIFQVMMLQIFKLKQNCFTENNLISKTESMFEISNFLYNFHEFITSKNYVKTSV